MFKKIFYTQYPALSNADAPRFSDKNYECVRLYLTKRGTPVAVSESRTKSSGNKVWRVQYGFSTVMFATYAEATEFCKKRFCGLDGRPLKEV